MVATRQAGEVVSCECGVSLTAPTLRRLRELPSAAAEAPAEKAAGGWTIRHGAVTAGLLLAAALAGGGFYLRAQEPSPPDPFSAATRDANVAELVANATPLELFGKWAYDYGRLGRTGFRHYDDPRAEATLRIISQLRLVQYSLLAAAGLVLVATIAAGVLIRGTP